MARASIVNSSRADPLPLLSSVWNYLQCMPLDLVSNATSTTQPSECPCLAVSCPWLMHKRT